MGNIIHTIDTSRSYQRGATIVNPGNPFNQLASGNVLRSNEPFIQTSDFLNVSASGHIKNLYGFKFDDVDYYHNPVVQFVPTSLSDLSVWLDATDIFTLWQESTQATPVTSDNDRVGFWADKSGNGFNWVQATAGDRPFYSNGRAPHPRHINGLPAVHTDNTTLYMLDNDDTIKPTNDDATVFIMAVNADPDSSLGIGFTVNNSGRRISWSSSDGNFVSDDVGSRGGDNTVNYRFDTAIWSFTYGSGILDPSQNEVRTHKNGVEGNLSPEAATGSDLVWGGPNGLFGRRNTDAFWMNGAMGEFILYNRLLSIAERNQVGQYLADKWDEIWMDIV